MNGAKIKRREFLKTAAIGTTWALLGLKSQVAASSIKTHPKRKPNLLFVFADQWRAQATGYAGDPNAKTPYLDQLAKESINFAIAVSGCPVCCPYRASLLTGQYPLTHGVFVNDVPLRNEAVSIAQAYNQAGYDTAYIGKWHLNGAHRDAYIPPDKRQGFQYWKAMGCPHKYNNSYYYENDNKTPLKWEGYDAIAQTKDAQQYIHQHKDGKPFALFLSWGPPHAPYDSAPEKYRNMFEADKIKLRPNVPEELHKKARKELTGYYAHIAALDDCLKDLSDTLKKCNIADDTIFVFTSDHGDMLCSQGHQKKQRPWDESIRVPFLLRYPAVHGQKGKKIEAPINTPDIMPTLLSLCGIGIPKTVEGDDLSGMIKGTKIPEDNPVLISCPAPFGQYQRTRDGGREYRGIRTKRYTYARYLTGPWLLYDNETDPYQMNNLCNKEKYTGLQKKMEVLLAAKLEQTNDEFLPGDEYIRNWGIVVDKTGTPPYYYSGKIYGNPY